jgi:methanogenic corrinoid protein MtbC1
VHAVQIQSVASSLAQQTSSRPAQRRTAIKRDIDPQAVELAAALIEPSLATASDLIDEFLANGATPTAMFTGLFEPAASCLGDLWDADECSEFEVTIGLCHLQTAMRRVSFNCIPTPAPKLAPRSVLVVPQPGEPHMFRAALDSELLWQAGWDVRCEFPNSDKALQDLVGAARYDVLDLSLSPALRREHWLPRIAATIAAVRRASRNPAIAIVVGGRLFTDLADAATQVGADAAGSNAREIERTIAGALSSRNAARRSQVASLS